MDEKKFEQYVQIITDKVYAQLLEKEKSGGKVDVKTEVKKVTSAPNFEQAGELLYSKKLLSETDARELIAMGAKKITCGEKTIITALAEELLSKKGVAVSRK